MKPSRQLPRALGSTAVFSPVLWDARALTSWASRRDPKEASLVVRAAWEGRVAAEILMLQGRGSEGQRPPGRSR
jgi:hypothetical protein